MGEATQAYPFGSQFRRLTFFTRVLVASGLSPPSIPPGHRCAPPSAPPCAVQPRPGSRSPSQGAAELLPPAAPGSSCSYTFAANAGPRRRRRATVPPALAGSPTPSA
ncbi:hypothetical protein BS78_05G216100 [Paspalum vaginatum]|nr:hypothetical protein BS78_05G216100 [Paspalum vaginatum]